MKMYVVRYEKNFLSGPQAGTPILLELTVPEEKAMECVQLLEQCSQASPGLDISNALRYTLGRIHVEEKV